MPLGEHWFGAAWKRDVSNHRQFRRVFFTNVWLYGALSLLVVGMASDRQALTLLALLVLVAAGVGWGWNRVCFSRITYSRSFSTTRVFPDEVVSMTLELVNRKPLPLPSVAIEDEISDGLRVLHRETIPSGTVGRQLLQITSSVHPYERVRWRIMMSCPSRGLHRVGPATLRSGDLFGFFSTRLRLVEEHAILVYPRTVELGDLGLPAHQPLGETRVARRLLTDPTRAAGVRDYLPDDPLRSIHWKASARQGKLQVRVNESTSARQLAVFVNLETFEHYWEGLDIELTERAIVAAASITRWAARHRYAVGVYANGVVAGSDQPLRVPPGRAPAQVVRIMEGLARVTPYSTLKFARTVRRESARLPVGTTLIIITPHLPGPLPPLIAELLASGQRVVMVPLGDCPVPTMRNLIVRRLDETALADAVARSGSRRRSGPRGEIAPRTERDLPEKNGLSARVAS